MATTADLGQKVKAKFPGAYDDLDDAELGRRVKEKFPGAYDDFADAPAEQAEPSKGESFARGAMQGVTLGLGDEAQGGVAALESTASAPFTPTPGPKALAQLYPGLPYPDAAARWFEEHRPDIAAAAAAEQGRQNAPAAYEAERDRVRTGNEEARAAHGGYYLWGQVAGGALPSAFTAGAGAPGSVGLGAVQGLGYSDADSGWGLARDTAVGAGLGLAGYGVGAALGRLASGVGKFASDRLGRALGRETARAAEEKTAAIQSAAGSLGGARAEANRVVEAIRGLLSEPNLTPQQRAALQAMQGTPEYAAAVQSLTGSLEKRLPDVAGKVATAEGVLANAQGGKPVAEMAKEGVSGKTAWQRGIKPRLMRYGPPAIASGVGAAIGGAPGAMVGALAGAGMRPSLRAMIRGIQDPAVQTAIWTPVAGAAKAGTSPVGRAATMSLSRAAAGAAPLDVIGPWASSRPGVNQSYTPPDPSGRTEE